MLWQSMVGKLVAKRFRQIFEYLDEAAVGQLNLIQLTTQDLATMDTLDSEVRADVEDAARIFARRQASAGCVFPAILEHSCPESSAIELVL